MKCTASTLSHGCRSGFYRAILLLDRNGVLGCINIVYRTVQSGKHEGAGLIAGLRGVL